MKKGFTAEQIIREAERSGDSSRSGEHSWRSEPQARDYGADLLQLEMVVRR